MYRALGLRFSLARRYIEINLGNGSSMTVSINRCFPQAFLNFSVPLSDCRMSQSQQFTSPNSDILIPTDSHVKFGLDRDSPRYEILFG